jgi:UDP-N-acetylmuramyl pentapeptide synthase
VGKWDGKNDKNTFIFENTQTLIAYFQSHFIKGKTILIKGSRGNKLELIVPFL